MRITTYGVYSKELNKVIATGCHYNKAEEKLAEMKEQNPNAELRIVWKRVNI